MTINLTDNFSARIQFRADSAKGPLRWAVIHELRGVGITGDLFVNEEGVSTALLAFHKAMLVPHFLVEQITLSSAANDGSPYNPDTFYTRSYQARGVRVRELTGEAVLPLTQVLHVKRLVGSGREGNMFLRGLLQEGDIESDSLTGTVVLSDPADIEGVLSAAWTALVAALATAGAEMVLAKVEAGVVSQVRPVVGMLVRGVTSKSLNNKYFDKVAAPNDLVAQIWDNYGPTVITQIIGNLLADGAVLPPLLP